ncbi:MAG: ATPase domain-containing protein [Methanomethylovorans sp.]|uniref:RAD55 family ATPase n=1 Tax=Methanomethylovorans sp. TaxID=2758717 RepID=UPI000AEA483C|nr:ATPase domain-containing protein [Methanomethylovorans sp.]
MRVPTGIPGFDELIEGGFIEDDVILIIGGPGAGKSTFGVQYLYEGITRYNDTGVYVTFDESPARIMRNMWRHNWDLERLIKENKLRIVRIDPLKYSRYIKRSMTYEKIDTEEMTLESVLNQIYHNVQQIGAKRLFIDSITTLKMSHDPVNIRFILLEFIKNIENMCCTTLISSENKYVQDTFNVEEYLAEGVISLNTSRIGNEKFRLIEVLKMRGVKHDESIHRYRITDAGLVVDPHGSLLCEKADIFCNTPSKKGEYQ